MSTHGFGVVFSLVRVVVDIEWNRVVGLVWRRIHCDTFNIGEFSVATGSVEFNHFKFEGYAEERFYRCQGELFGKGRVLDESHSCSETRRKDGKGE